MLIAAIPILPVFLGSGGINSLILSLLFIMPVISLITIQQTTSKHKRVGKQLYKEESEIIKVLPQMDYGLEGNSSDSYPYYIPLIDVRSREFSPLQLFWKRLLDVTIAAVIMLVLLPLWFLIAFIIKLDSRGPVFYRQERVGENGKIFKLIKFRSMVDKAEENTGPVWAAQNDNRITRFGSLLRETHLDELPQLINVLLGNMSLVGPRPERPYFVEKLAIHLPNYSQRLQIRPGITGWAQVNYKYDSSLDDVKNKLGFDLSYIKNITILMDLKIICLTAKNLVTGLLQSPGKEQLYLVGSKTEFPEQG